MVSQSADCVSRYSKRKNGKKGKINYTGDDKIKVNGKNMKYLLMEYF